MAIEKQVWKFELRLADEQRILMPVGAQIVDVQMQGPKMVAWAIVDPDKADLPVTIYIRGTGHPLPANVVHIASVQDGSFVWHVFTDRRIAPNAG